MQDITVILKNNHITVIQTATATFVWRAPEWDEMPQEERDFLDRLWEKVSKKFLGV